MAKCPKCGSERFHYELRSGGTNSRTNYYKTGFKGWFIPAGRKKYSSERKHIRIGICPDCGYTTSGGGGSDFLKGILVILVIIGVIAAAINSGKKNESKKSGKTVAPTATMQVTDTLKPELTDMPEQISSGNDTVTTTDTPVTEVPATEMLTATPTEEPTATPTPAPSVWAQEVTPLEDFKYYIDGDKIYLKDYKGKDKKVRIGDRYVVDGKEYLLGESLEGLFAVGNVTSVIIPEGVVSVKANIFNSCGVKYIYLPKSLKDGGKGYAFYKYFHDVEKIYYGGTEEEWHILTNNAERSDIDVVQIVFEAKIEDLADVE